jgi:diadenylate cyclase
MLTPNIVNYWKPLVEIIILWFLIYHILLFFEGTRAVLVMRGIVVLIVAFLIFQKLNLLIMDWLLTKLFGISVIAILIIFHPEIRQGLARLGQRHIFSPTLESEELECMLRQIEEAANNLAKKKLGALIALEKNFPLAEYIESGVLIDSRISAELIEAIFTPQNPLHDGGIIIQQDRIAAAGCFFPLSQNAELSRLFGTRHRAAFGLSEETDAIIIVVSEERQDISLFYRRKLYKDLGQEEFVSRIKELLKSKNA